LKYTGDQQTGESKKTGFQSKFRPIYLLGFVVWLAVVVVAIMAIQYEPDPEPRGVLSIGSADAPVTVMEFSDFQ
jgi:hypothetical protein